MRTAVARQIEAMPHVREGILDIEMDHDVQSLLQLIDRHELRKELSVWRVHRHFDGYLCLFLAFPQSGMVLG